MNAAGIIQYWSDRVSIEAKIRSYRKLINNFMINDNDYVEDYGYNQKLFSNPSKIIKMNEKFPTKIQHLKNLLQIYSILILIAIIILAIEILITFNFDRKQMNRFTRKITIKIINNI